MKVYVLYLVQLCILFLFCNSCQKDLTKQNQKLLIGEWRFAEAEDSSWDDEYMFGYKFMEDGLCENNLGFFSYYNPTGFFLHTPKKYCMGSVVPSYLFGGKTALNNVSRYYGNRTYYKIKGDTLKIYDPAKNVWSSQYIRFKSPDSLIVSYINECQEQVFLSLIRKEYKTNGDSLFDQLIFNYPEGVRERSFFSIRRDGLFVSYGYKGKDDFFVGKMKEGEFERIENLFRKIDFSKTEPDGWYEYYYYEPKIIMIKNNDMKIISSMAVARSNKEFYWVYLSSLFSPDNIYMQPTRQHEYIKKEFLNLNVGRSVYSYYYIKKEYIEIENYFFKEDLFTLQLSCAETFYLKLLLMKASETDYDFAPVYNMGIDFGGAIDVETDGRYYRFYDENGKKITLDIGINYIEDINRTYINPYNR